MVTSCPVSVINRTWNVVPAEAVAVGDGATGLGPTDAGCEGSVGLGVAMGATDIDGLDDADAAQPAARSPATKTDLDVGRRRVTEGIIVLRPYRGRHQRRG